MSGSKNLTHRLCTGMHSHLLDDMGKVELGARSGSNTPKKFPIVCPKGGKLDSRTASATVKIVSRSQEFRLKPNEKTACFMQRQTLH